MSTWSRFQEFYCEGLLAGVDVDISRMNFGPDFFATMEPRIQEAFAAMAKLEAGAIANPDENRMVGHYWLRAPELAPTPQIASTIRDAIDSIKKFAAAVHSGEVRGPSGKPFMRLLVVGIGGSALGPQLAADALGSAADKMAVRFLDNTDPDGIDRTLGALGPHLDETLAVVVSKSGGTPESRNGMLEAAAAWKRAGADFPRCAVAVTGETGALRELAQRENWLAIFPMWDWVGGRTSIFSAVGLLPAALQGIDIDEFLDGARRMDQDTREAKTRSNPAALLALMWHHAGEGRGAKDMVVLPYKDRLVLFSKYLQQLVMESLGKERDLDGKVVHQGIAVYGNKGSTDQHAYVQQLRDGVNNFFVTFIEVLRGREGPSIEVEPGVTSGDYLGGLLLGTRRALHESGRESITITIEAVSPRSLGALIALFERAVGLYASLVHINAYHQPGVEAGKRAAKAAIELQAKAVAEFRKWPHRSFGVEDLAEAIGEPAEIETLFKILHRLASNRGSGVVSGSPPFGMMMRFGLDPALRPGGRSSKKEQD